MTLSRIRGNVLWCAETLGSRTSVLSRPPYLGRSGVRSLRRRHVANPVSNEARQADLVILWLWQRSSHTRRPRSRLSPIRELAVSGSLRHSGVHSQSGRYIAERLVVNSGGTSSRGSARPGCWGQSVVQITRVLSSRYACSSKSRCGSFASRSQPVVFTTLVARPGGSCSK